MSLTRKPLFEERVPGQAHVVGSPDRLCTQLPLMRLWPIPVRYERQ